ncbi:uncharacterized protein LOC131316348 [Rhododendron vialii]|uniref:uncharacterized protein LOC131316348 n=1 Tax=Rhododendron vialii TaxID=182163 RepID=UPI00265F6F00|nr:uncharacterized protein LOC131316348 [Rhododendron vialii]
MVIITETRIGGERATKASANLGFTKVAISDSAGFAGEGDLQCDILDVTPQEIHACIQVSPTSTPWILSAIYARPNYAVRREQWDNLTQFADSHNSPWIMAGDFNEVLSSSDKFGGRPISNSRSSAFCNCIDCCGMHDLGFSGPRFTWTNTQVTGGLIKERLDRVWSNSSWNLIYPEAHVSHLPRTHSDHCPILLSTVPNSGPPNPRPFRFESVWFSDPSVFSVIEDSWSTPSPSFAFTTNLFANKITIWNKENFGHIFHKKKRLLARLSGTQKALDLNPNKFLTDLEQTLISDFNKILILEEEFWALKSRVNWLSDGDRNTRL